MNARKCDSTSILNTLLKKYKHGSPCFLPTIIHNPNTETYSKRIVIETCQRTRVYTYSTSRHNQSFSRRNDLHNYQSFYYNDDKSRGSTSVANTALLHEISALRGKRDVTSLRPQRQQFVSPYVMALHSTGPNNSGSVKGTWATEIC